MKEWNEVRLGDIADFSNGINFDKNAYANGVKLIGVSNFGDRFYPPYEDLEEVKKDVVRSNDYLKKDDIVFVRSNGNKELVGRCMLIGDISIPLTYSGFCIRCRLKDFNLYNPVFFTYYFKSKLFRRSMSGTAVGANIQNLSQGRLASHILKVPDFELQGKIADILLNYEKCIEKNKKQIKLLEEAAQRLYKEWFVDLRFPGHEDVDIVNNLPDGWLKLPIDDAYSIKYGKTLPTSKISSDGKYPVYGASKQIGFYDEKNCDDYRVLITSRGDAGNVYRTHHKESFITNNSFIVTPLLDYIHNLFIFFQMKDLDFKAVTTGSCQPQLTNNSISRKYVLIPSRSIMNSYNLITDDLFMMIENKIMENRLLIEARDRLLPKLMSGEIER